MNLRRLLFSIFMLIVFCFACTNGEQENPLVTIQTAEGTMIVELYPEKAPKTVANFLRYVEADLYDGSYFYRTTRPDNDPMITVIQGGLWRPWEKNMIKNYVPAFPVIAHETTKSSGLTHTNGVISMARLEPGTASSEFFISVGDNPSLDFGGQRNPDGQGFAVFGRVIAGMEVVQAIHVSETNKGKGFLGQVLVQPVIIMDIQCSNAYC